MSNRKLTVGELRRILEDALRQLDGYDPGAVVAVETNTYPLRVAWDYVFIAGRGFVSLDKIGVRKIKVRKPKERAEDVKAREGRDA